MHELSLATRLVDRAVSAAASHGADHVDELTVEIGEATHINPDQLRFCIEVALDGTVATDATVTIDTLPVCARCECGWDGRPERHDLALSYAPDVRCPECQSTAALESGRECRLKSIEIPEKTQRATSETREPAENNDNNDNP